MFLKTTTIISRKVLKSEKEVSFFSLLLAFWACFTFVHYYYLIHQITQIQSIKQHDKHIKHTSQGIGYDQLCRKRRNVKAFVGTHLEGSVGDDTESESAKVQNPSPNEVFEWGEGKHSFHMNVDINNMGRNGTYVEIIVPGYYFIYAQITFNTDGNNNVCYDTIKIDESNEVVLLTSCAIQVKKNTKYGKYNSFNYQDSSYHGGVFWLNYKEKIGIKPTLFISNAEDNGSFLFESAKAYFGAFRVFE